eukprot:1177051-Prorocentrum_minimum.AAC.3
MSATRVSCDAPFGVEARSHSRTQRCACKYQAPHFSTSERLAEPLRGEAFPTWCGSRIYPGHGQQRRNPCAGVVGKRKALARCADTRTLHPSAHSIPELPSCGHGFLRTRTPNGLAQLTGGVIVAPFLGKERKSIGPNQQRARRWVHRQRARHCNSDFCILQLPLSLTPFLSLAVYRLFGHNGRQRLPEARFCRAAYNSVDSGNF